MNNKKVLIVEDTKSINSILAHNIKNQLNIEVASAYSMQQAKSIVENHEDDFFLAILDLNLPDSPDGEIVDYCREKEITSIVLTATMNDDIHDNMMSKGIIDYVVKRNLNEIQYIIDSVERLNANFERKILVVDDSISSRQFIRYLLEKSNFKVIDAKNGEEGLQKLRDNPDVMLIITDYYMPKMDGMEFIVNARKEHSSHDLGIIGVSAKGSTDISVKMLKSGADDFINRPFLWEELYCRVNQNIDRIVGFAKIKEAATKDYLTGLFNRKYIFETGEKLFENARRKNFSLTAAMFDLDYFKNVNDSYGHYVGDQVLKHISDILSSHLREADIIARMGGEEFCCLFVNSDPHSAAALFERIRSSIVDEPLRIEELEISVTVSIGYSDIMAESLDELIHFADVALYQSKEAGRNRVTKYAKQKNLKC